MSELVRKKPLYGIFTEIPSRYDLINRIITWGLDRGWRDAAAAQCLVTSPQRVLDLCCGTGDLAVTIARMADYPLEIKGLDYSQPMLDIAAGKAAAYPGKNITFTRGDAANLPYPDGFFDCIGISFAFRNLVYKNSLASNHQAEIFRALKPGGRFVIAESSQPENRFVRTLYHFYMRQYVFRVGAWLSGNRAAYRYLAESASGFYSPAELKDRLIRQGYQQVTYRPLLLGAAGIYVAVK